MPPATSSDHLDHAAVTRCVQLLREQRQSILDKWLKAVNASYPFGSTGFSLTREDPFLNPVGARGLAAGEAMLRSLLEEDPDLAAEALEEFMRVRAAQDLSPEEAVGVMHTFKSILYDLLLPQLEAAKAGPTAFIRLERQLDALTLLAFSVYTRCREQIQELRVREFQRRHASLLRQAGGQKNLV
jgi:hypothetical protein